MTGLTFANARQERWIRGVMTITLFVLYYSAYAHYPPLVVAMAGLILAIYLALFWAGVRSWPTTRIVGLCAFILAAGLTLRYTFGAPADDLIGPLVAVMALQRARVWPEIVALAVLAALLFAAYPGALPVGTVLGLAGLYFWLRGRRIREDAYALSQMHLGELRRANEELQEATVDSVRSAALEERVRISREIHDGLGHQLTSLIIQLQALELMLPDNPERAAETTGQLLAIARDAMSEVRTAVRGWSGDETGLGVVALKGLIARIQARSPVQIAFAQESDLSAWSAEVTVVLYRVLQEALTNVLRHARARAVTVVVREEGKGVVLTVADDGRYHDGEPLTPGFGLRGIAERCRTRGGTFAFRGVDPHGLCIEASLPLQDPNLAPGGVG